MGVQQVKNGIVPGGLFCEAHWCYGRTVYKIKAEIVFDYGFWTSICYQNILLFRDLLTFIEHSSHVLNEQWTRKPWVGRFQIASVTKFLSYYLSLSLSFSLSLSLSLSPIYLSISFSSSLTLSISFSLNILLS